MGWQPGNDRRRPPPVLLGVLWIAVVALALAGCSKGQAKGQEASTAGLPVYKASVQKFKYSGMPTSIKSGESIITLTNRESGEITHEFVLLALPSGKSTDDIVAAVLRPLADTDYALMNSGRTGSTSTPFPLSASSPRMPSRRLNGTWSSMMRRISYGSPG